MLTATWPPLITRAQSCWSIYHIYRPPLDVRVLFPSICQLLRRHSNTMAPLTMQLLRLVAAATVATASTISKDVVIIGGGASGSYAGIRLKEDFGKDIALIETENRLVRCHTFVRAKH